jgi:UDP-N-acetylmuramoyl-L-alanyl-D-glutamate--2,6-diaminopimelate ligase
MKLTDLGEGVLKVAPKHGNLEAAGITSDSRSVKPGFLFVAVPGEDLDGHQFIPDAISAGAVAIVGERKPRRWSAKNVPFIPVTDSRNALGQLGAAFYQYPSKSVSVCGITGTKGKTTTAWILHSIFQATGRRAGLFGTVLNRIGEQILPSINTTPGALEIVQHLRDLADRGGSHAVMEVSSHGIAQNRTSGIDFACGVFTNITPEHLDYHGTFKQYLKTKRRFFEELPSDAVAVLPREDEHAEDFAAHTDARISFYSGQAQDGVESVQLDADGMSFLWHGHVMRTGIWGEHNFANVLAAITAADAMGIEPPAIGLGLERAVAPPGRLEEIDNDLGCRIYVDYAHTDSALRAVLLGLRPITPGRIITVFGCGGDRDRLKRPRMGRIAEELSDKVVLTSDNPRSEEPSQILDEIAGGMDRPFAAAMIVDRRDAIALALRMSKPGDAVLIAGKGHEAYQEVLGKRIDFDDRNVARELVEMLQEENREEGKDSQ